MYIIKKDLIFLGYAMFRYIFAVLVFSVVAIPTAVMAGDEPTLIDLFGEEDAKEKQAQLDTPAAPQATEVAQNAPKEKVDDDGIFSFLNFSFLRKKEKPQPAATTTATANISAVDYEQQMTTKAEAGDVDAALTLGYMYLYGENGVTQNSEKAFKYYSMAAEKKDIIALNNLGSLYFNGIGTSRNIEKAVSLFDEAAQLGNNEAAVNLAFIYLSSQKASTPEIRERAIKLFSQAAQGGNITAQYMLGMIYYNGFGVAKDYDTAFRNLRKAASKFDEAQYQLAQLYMNAEGTPRNYGNAVNNLARAAQQGHIKSMILLGDILSSGRNYPLNVFDAYVWYNIASVYDAQNASEKRDFLEKKLKIEEVLQAQTKAEKFKTDTNEITQYIHSTFGYDLAKYVTEKQPAPQPQTK